MSRYTIVKRESGEATSIFKRIQKLKSWWPFALAGTFASFAGGAYTVYQTVIGEQPRILIDEIFVSKEQHSSFSKPRSAELFIKISAKPGMQIENMSGEVYTLRSGKYEKFNVGNALSGYLDDEESVSGFYAISYYPQAIYVCTKMDASFWLKKWAVYKYVQSSENEYNIPFKSGSKPITGAYISNKPECLDLISKM